MNEQPAQRWEGNLALLMTALISASLFWRIHFGIDFTDESFYVALSYRFSLGDTPFVDELNLLQSSALLTLPFVKLYLRATGSAAGIILFTRVLYVVFLFLMSTVVFGSLRALLPWPKALLMSSICLVFIPFNIPNLSYNTMGMGFFVMGCFLGLRVVLPLGYAPVERPRRVRSLVFAGCCHALAVVAYPTMLVAVGAYFIALVYLLEQKRQCGLYLAGAVPVLLGVMWQVSGGGIDGVLESIRYTQTRPVGGGFQKLLALVRGLGNSLLHGWLTLVVGGLVLVLRRRGSKWAFSLLVLLPLTTFRARYGFGIPMWSMGVVLHLGLLSLFFYALAPLGVHRKMFVLISVPSFVAGLVFAYTSSNGFISAGLGLLPAALTGLVYLVAAVSAGVQDDRGRFTLVLFAFVLVLGGSQYVGFYRDGKYSTLVARVEGGPYAGLYTSPTQHVQITMLQRALRAVVRPSDAKIFFYGFPAGYLLTDLKPAARNLWTDPIDLESTLRYFQGKELPAMIIENTNRRPARGERLRGPIRDEALREFLSASGYALVAAEKGFEIYRRR